MIYRIILYTVAGWLCLISVGVPAHAQDGWLPLDGPASASIEDVERTSDGTLFAIGTYCYRSGDHGKTWSRVPLELSDDGGFSLDSGPDGWIILQRNTSGFQHSTDGGSTWSYTYSWNSVVLCTHTRVTPMGTLLAARRSFLFRSTDSGRTIDTVIEEGRMVMADSSIPRTTSITALDIMPDSSILIGVRNLSLRILPARNHSVYRSTDDGQTWRGIRLASIGNNVSTLRALPNGHILVACADSNAVFRSTDTGATWVRLSSPDDTLFITRFGAAVDGSIVAADLRRGIIRSSDDGTTWTTVLDTEAAFHVRDFETAADGSMIAATSVDAIYRSTDNGASWSRSSSGIVGTNVHQCLITPDDVLIVGTDHPQLGAQLGGFELMSKEGLRGNGATIRRSTDRGRTWTQVAGFGYTVEGFARADDGMIFAAVGDSGLLRSTDEGATWEHAEGNLPTDRRVINNVFASSHRSIYVDARDVVSGPKNGDLFVSEDGGETWTPTMLMYAVERSSATLKTLVLLPDRTLLVALRDRGVWRRREGSQWEQIKHTALPHQRDQSIEQMFLRPDSSVVVLAPSLNSSSIWRSTDRGSSWVPTSERDSILHLTTGPRNSLIGLWRRMYISYDDGGTWEPLGPIVPFENDSGTVWANLNTVAVASDGEAFIGTHRDGMLSTRLTLSDVSLSDRSEIGLTITPNPTASLTTLTFRLDLPTTIEIRLTDLQGRCHYAFSEHREAGKQIASIDTERLASGMYLVEFKAGGVSRSRHLVVVR